MGEVTISILSQNGINKNTSNHIEKIISKEPDIYIEFTQEDNRRDHHNTILNNEFIKNKYKLMNMEQSSRRFTFTGGYNIVSKIFKKNDSEITIGDNIENTVIYISTDGSIVDHNPFLSSKAAVCSKLLINNQLMLFVNLHLPMSKGKSDLGLAERTRALNGVISKLITNNILTNETTLIIGGDLNFRMDEKGKDQLTELLKKEPILYNRRLVEFSDEQNRFTCKLTNKLNNFHNIYRKGITECRQTAVDIDNKLDTQKKVQRDCGVDNRLPSKCDRFLISETRNASIKQLTYQAVYLDDIKSDHNAVYCIFIVDSAQKAGAKRRKYTKRNYRKRKTIKNKKSNK